MLPDQQSATRQRIASTGKLARNRPKQRLTGFWNAWHRLCHAALVTRTGQRQTLKILLTLLIGFVAMPGLTGCTDLVGLPKPPEESSAPAPTSPPVVEGEPEVRKVTVELDIFSGQPNPVWELAAEEVTELDALLTQLEATSPRPVYDELGYRGFVIVYDQGSAQERLFRVYGEMVVEEREQITTHYQDPERTIERWLIAQARTHLPDDLITLLPLNNFEESEDQS